MLINKITFYGGKLLNPLFLMILYTVHPIHIGILIQRLRIKVNGKKEKKMIRIF
jgi:hypothetical protein